MADVSATDRRELLKKIAAAGAGAAIAPIVISTPAFGDSGTQKCRFGGYSSAATVAITLIRGPLLNGNVSTTFTGGVPLTFTAPVGGTCPCSPSTARVLRYQYWIQIRRYTAASGGSAANTHTQSSTDWSLSGPTVAVTTTGFGVALSNYYEVDLQVGWRAQCPGVGATPARMCRFATFSSGRVGPISANGTVWSLAASAMTSSSVPSNLTGC